MNAFLFLMAFSISQVSADRPRSLVPVPPVGSVKESSSFPDYPLDPRKLGITLPETHDPFLKKILTSKTTIFYKLPQIWQHWIPSSVIERRNLTTGLVTHYTTNPIFGIHRASYLPEFNANGLFPWETTIGLNSSRKEADIYRTINFLSLPPATEAKDSPVVPVLVINDYPIKWLYPSGTTVGEVIYVIHDDVRYVQEIRTRTKSQDSTEWTPALFRPVRNRDEFKQLTKIEYTPAYRYMFFRNPQEDEVFLMQGLVERLPPLTEASVKKLLALPFVSVEQSSKDTEVWSPASDQEFSILPKNYCFSLLRSLDSHTCAGCHRQTQISVSHLTPKEPLIMDNPSKVGNIRGCDAVFTWYPFDETTIPGKGSGSELTASLRKHDSMNGVIKIHGKNNAKNNSYKLTKFVQESLRPHELPSAEFLHDTTK